jgi:hypothetical protein
MSKLTKNIEQPVVEDQDLVPYAPVTVMPVVSGPEFAQSFKAYKALQRAIDESMPEEIMEIQGKPYRKKGYWKALRAAFNLTLECIHDERVEIALEDGSVDWGWHVRYRASTQSGAFVDGDGSCFASEKSRGGLRSTEHNVRAHAHTRASNRAISSLVGFGEVSDDEMPVDADRTVYVEPVQTPKVEAPKKVASKAAKKTEVDAADNTTQDGVKKITVRQVKYWHVLVKNNGRDPEACQNYLEKTYGSPDPADIPFSDFNDVVKWLNSDEYFEATQ